MVRLLCGLRDGESVMSYVYARMHGCRVNPNVTASTHFGWHVSTEVAAESANKRRCTIQLFNSTSHDVMPEINGFWVWLSDTPRGGLTSVAPSTWVWRQSAAKVIFVSATNKKLYLARTSSTGKCSVELGFPSTKTWYINTTACNGVVKTSSVAFT